MWRSLVCGAWQGPSGGGLGTTILLALMAVGRGGCWWLVKGEKMCCSRRWGRENESEALSRGNGSDGSSGGGELAARYKENGLGFFVWEIVWKFYFIVLFFFFLPLPLLLLCEINIFLYVENFVFFSNCLVQHAT